MEGLTASELSMIKKLAGNDGVVRKKTMKKLKTWLTAIATRAPDSPDCRAILENNFLRVWTALFYCMWMADKPLPQEQLADQISSLLAVFQSKPHVMNLFVEWFFRTMAREWPNIDRWRMDKFQMLVRRFLRRVFLALEENKWKVELLDGFLKILSVNIFNRRPELKATRASVRVPGIEICPVGLQTHILDIFMEELAKVGGNTLKNKKILKILAPFIHEVCHNDDDRVLSEVQERIFRHLMRQSDAGIDYAEGVSADQGANEDEDASDDEDDGDFDEEDQMLEEELENVGPLDPRAGGIDVILPQLKVDYNELAEKLTLAGGQKSVRPKNRKIAYTLAKQFKEISAGQYPLAIPEDDDRSPPIKNTDIDRAARRLLQFEESLVGAEKKMRKSKKARKKLAKEAMATSGDLDSSETAGSESDNTNSFYLEDSELLDHVGDNYMSYLEELHQKESTKANGMQNGDVHNENDEDEVPEGTPKKSKRRRLSKLSNGTSTPEAKDPESSDIVTPLRKTLKQRKSLNVEAAAETSPISVPKKKIVKKRMSLPAVISAETAENVVEASGKTAGAENGDSEVHILVKSKKRKQSPSASKLEGPQTPSTPSGGKKRVSFVLARNLHHEHADYEQSINRSPAIPYDSGKKPGTPGLLKSPKSPAISASYFSNGLQSTPRRKSGRF